MSARTPADSGAASALLGVPRPPSPGRCGESPALGPPGSPSQSAGSAGIPVPKCRVRRDTRGGAGPGRGGRSTQGTALTCRRHCSTAGRRRRARSGPGAPPAPPFVPGPARHSEAERPPRRGGKCLG